MKIRNLLIAGAAASLVGGPAFAAPVRPSLKPVVASKAPSGLSLTVRKGNRAGATTDGENSLRGSPLIPIAVVAMISLGIMAAFSDSPASPGS